MSESSKKQPIEDEKTVFDRCGIGHNGGPELSDLETEIDVDESGARTKRGPGGDRRGRTLSDANRDWLKQKEKAGELAKVIRDDECGSVEFGDWERAANNRRGVHSQLSRRGKLRIFRGPTDEEREWCQDNTWKLQQAAARVLHGRDATIFEKHVLSPLQGGPKSSAEELAAQFDIAVKRVYKIIEKCRERIRRAMRGESAPRSSEIKSPHVVGVSEIRENDIDFLVYRYSDGDHHWSRIWKPPAPLESMPIKEEPVEKWKLEEQQRVEKLRERIRLQAEARINKLKESK